MGHTESILNCTEFLFEALEQNAIKRFISSLQTLSISNSFMIVHMISIGSIPYPLWERHVFQAF